MYRRRRFFDLISEIEEMEREIERFLISLKEGEVKSRCMEPLYEVIETPDEVVVTFDLPGVRREDIRLEIDESRMVLEAPCTAHPLARLGRFEFERYRTEVSLPLDVDVNRVTTKYKEGVLEVRVAKKVKGYRIKVE
ncbi:MAG: Hsp20/alpha crystallin family protein [Aigarchaeota archaeon]|nr:Hsp20/alpha crystallin family protein [Aigarchaeota archaeon]MDW8093189.1 Hsp20/alpha crystallin family protein [Nitrososphaerota archaeon]